MYVKWSIFLKVGDSDSLETRADGIVQLVILLLKAKDFSMHRFDLIYQVIERKFSVLYLMMEYLFQLVREFKYSLPNAVFLHSLINHGYE